jgi:hypothetical protein
VIREDIRVLRLKFPELGEPTEAEDLRVTGFKGFSSRELLNEPYATTAS